MAWERLHHGAITANGNTGAFTPKKNMRVILNIKNSGNIQPELTCGTGGSIDTGNNYATRGFSSDINSSDYTRTSQDSIETERATNGNMYLVFDVTNVSNKEKLFIGHAISAESAGAGNVPVRWEIAGKWANTSGQINIIGLKNTQGGSIASGSTITVLGAKEPATADSITTGTLTAKKNLMILAKTKSDGQVTANYRFNADSGSNYARRNSTNGGSDGTGTSQNVILAGYGTSGETTFITSNVTNEASKEKLVITEVVASTSGAGTAPNRREIVGKWANTSNASTSVTLFNNDTGSFLEGTELIVWGSDGASDTTNPTIVNGFILEETDTGKHYIWNATTSTWTEIA